ncbi:hypothetical protein Tco_1506887 [Tanacetum coccineum]
MPSLRCSMVDKNKNDEGILLNLDLLEEKRELTAIAEEKHKRRMERYYNLKVRNTILKHKDLVYQINEASKKEYIGKLGPKWEGPYEVTDALDAEFEEMEEVDIETLTMEQYLALNHGDIRRGVRKLEIEKNVDFEIKGQFLRELGDNTFSRNENEGAHEHVGRILEITSLFNIAGVSGDSVILRVFPITLTGRAKRWLERAPTTGENS